MYFTISMHAFLVFADFGDADGRSKKSISKILSSCFNEKISIAVSDISAFLSGEIKNAILLLLEEQTDQKQSDDILVEKVRNLEHKIKEIMDDDDDKYSAEELSAFLDMDLEEIQGILRLTGEDN